MAKYVVERMAKVPPVRVETSNPHEAPAKVERSPLRAEYERLTERDPLARPSIMPSNLDPLSQRLRTRHYALERCRTEFGLNVVDVDEDTRVVVGRGKVRIETRTPGREAWSPYAPA